MKKVRLTIFISILTVNILNAQDFKPLLDSIQKTGNIMQFEETEKNWFVQKAQIHPNGREIWATVIDSSNAYSLQRVARFEKEDSIWQMIFLSDEGYALGGFKNGRTIFASTKAGIGWNISGIRNRGWNQTRDYICSEEVFFTSDRSGKFQIYMKDGRKSLHISENYPDYDVINFSMSNDSSIVLFDIINNIGEEIRYANLWSDGISTDRKLEGFDGYRSLSFNDNMLVAIKNGKIYGREIITKEYNHKLKRKIGDKTYVEYVSSMNYGFYNNIINLTDSMHSDVITAPIEDIRDKKISVFHIIDNIGTDEDWFLAVCHGDTVIIIPIETARDGGVKIGDNVIRSENITQEEYKFLADNYVVCKESLFFKDDAVTDNTDVGTDENSTEKFSTNNTRSNETLSEKEKAEKFRNMVEFGKEYSQNELTEKLIASGYTTGFLQLGLYPDETALVYIQAMMPDACEVQADLRMEGSSLLEFFVIKKTEDIFDALRVAKFQFKRNKRTRGDDPFLRFGPWPKPGIESVGVKIVHMSDSGKFTVQSL